MKTGIPDARASFAEKVRGIAEALGGGRYDECLRRAAELTQFSCVLQHNDWIFVCEVLESVFFNMADIVKEHKIPNDAEAGIRKRLCGDLEDVIRAYENEDDAGRYAALKKIGSDATMFQMNASTAYPERGLLG